MNLHFSVHRPFDIRNRPRIPIPDEDDPYAIAADIDSSGGSSSFGNGIYGQIGRDQIAMKAQHPQLRRDKPPKLPPRDKIYGHHEIPSAIKVSSFYSYYCVNINSNYSLFLEL